MKSKAARGRKSRSGFSAFCAEYVLSEPFRERVPTPPKAFYKLKVFFRGFGDHLKKNISLDIIGQVYYNQIMKIGKTIILVRHASTAHNENGIWQGRADYPLSDTGRNEAGLLAGQLKDNAFDVVFHSPMARAIQTAEIINKYHNAKFIPIDEFIEIDLGELDGVKHTDILKNHPEIHRNWVMDIDSPIPGGESFADIFHRVKPGVEKVLASPYHSILIVAHAMVNRAILGHMVDMGPIPSRKFRMDNAAYSRLIVYESPFGKHTALDSWNITSHLAGAVPKAYEQMEEKGKTK